MKLESNVWYAKNLLYSLTVLNFVRIVAANDLSQKAEIGGYTANHSSIPQGQQLVLWDNNGCAR